MADAAIPVKGAGAPARRKSKGEDRAGSAPWLLASPSLLLLVGLLLVPLLMTAALSFNSFDGTQGIKPGFTWGNYIEVLTDPYYHDIFLRTGGLALGVTVLCALFGVPETLILARMKSPWRGMFLVVILGPLLISVVVRTLGWAILFGSDGLINNTLMTLGVTSEPVRLLYTLTGVTIGLTHVLIPFMVISVWANLQKLDPQVENAGLSLGASPLKVFWRIMIPQLLPGILSGSIIVFALAASAFATPALLGGRRLKVVATATYDEYLSTLNWPLGATIAVLLLVANAAIILGANRWIERRFRQVFAA